MPSLPFIYGSRLTPYDKWTVAIYLLITAIIATYSFRVGVNDSYIVNKIIVSYAFITQLFLYFFCYKSLRNFTVYLIWLVIAIAHFLCCAFIYNSQSLKFFFRNAGISLRNTVVLLVLFQILRFISLKIQNKELVTPSRGSWTDTFDERRLTVVDFVLFFVYFGLLLYLSY